MSDGGSELEVTGRGLPAGRGAPTALQVARGMGGIGLLWSGAWATLNTVFSVGVAVVNGWPLAMVVPGIVRFGLWGGLCGAVFALTLSLAERRKSLDDLSLVRVGLWGGVGTFALVLLMIFVSGILPVLGLDYALLQALQGGVLGAVSAVGTTWAAKAAPEST